jgi:hypothetical protein
MIREDALQKLNQLDQEIRKKVREHCDLLKRAESTDWDGELLKQADRCMEEASAINLEFRMHLDILEETMTQEERNAIDAAEAAEKSMLKMDAVARLWKRELSTDSVQPTTALTIDESISAGIGKILAHVPKSWLNEQLELCKSATPTHPNVPLLLYGNTRSDEPKRTGHAFGRALTLAMKLVSNSADYDIYEGAILVPQIAALCLTFDYLKGVKGGIGKFEELSRAPDSEMPGRIFELLVAAHCAELGRIVEFLDPSNAKTLDLRINDFPFPAVIECKRQSVFSAYEQGEISKLADVFQILRSDPRSQRLVGDLRLVFSKDIDAVPTQDIVRDATDCLRKIDPYGSLETDWGTLDFVSLEVSSLLEHETSLYSPYFLENVFGWNTQTTNYDGLCAIVKNDASRMTGRGELPFSLRWRAEATSAIERKARCVTSLLAEAVSQIPVGEGGFIYISYDDFHRAEVADRRTSRILQMARGFQIRERGVRPPMMIVISRLFPNSLGEGKPDLIESCLPLTTEKENRWGGIMPGRVFT